MQFLHNSIVLLSHYIPVCTLVYYSSIYSSRDLWPYMVLPRTVIIDTQSVSTHIFIIYVVMTPGHVHHVKVNYISIFLL